MEAALDRRVPLRRPAMYAAIDSTEALDASTFLVKWKAPSIQADLLLTDGALPMPGHLIEAAYREQDPIAFVGLPYWTTEFIGTGPFKLHDWEVGSHMILRANDFYFLGRPRLDELEIRFVLDSTAMVANLLAGSIDLNIGRGLSLEQAVQARDQWAGRGQAEFEVQNWSALYPQFIDPNPPILLNVDFRRALVHALNRQELTDLLQDGLGPVAHTFLIPGSEEYESASQHIVRYEYDPRRAMQLMEQIGLTRGSDGMLQDSSAQPVVVQVRTTRDDQRERVMYSLSDYWRAVGIRMEPSLIATQAQQARDYRATRPAFEFTRTPANPDGYHSSGIPRAENSFNGDNRSRYSNAELDALIDRYYATVPKRERYDALGGLIRHLTDQVVATGVFYTVVPALLSDRVVNATMPKVVGGRITFNAHEWDAR
jgi:peptide/nickel transport system substrate-binding protein